MDGLDERLNMLRGRVLRDPMAQVEYMARPGAKRRQDAPRLGGNRLGRTEKRHRVHVSLKRHPCAHATASLSQVGLPVDAERIRTGVGHRLQPEAPAFGEEDARDSAILASTRETRENLPR